MTNPEPETELERLRRYEREHRDAAHADALRRAQAAGLCGTAAKLIELVLNGSAPEARDRLLMDTRALLQRAGEKLAGAADWKAPAAEEED